MKKIVGWGLFFILLFVGVGLVSVGVKPDIFGKRVENIVGNTLVKGKSLTHSVGEVFGDSVDNRYRIVYSGVTGGAVDLDTMTDWVNLGVFEDTGWVVWGQHNGYGGDVVLSLSEGDEVVIVEDGIEYPYIVNGILDDYKFGSVEGVDRLGREGFGLQSCHYGVDSLRIVSLYPVSLGFQAPSAFLF